MPLHVIGLNHVSAPLDVREKVAFPAERQAQALSELAAQPSPVAALNSSPMVVSPFSPPP